MKFLWAISLLFWGLGASVAAQETALQVGAERMDTYLPLLDGKSVALVVNQTSMVDSTHLVDALLQKGVDIQAIFAPEHGFRGTADAGETVRDNIDVKTGIPIVSLYGKNKKPSAEQLEGIEMVIFDIQDVGARFYTYISTMHYVMEACAEQGKQLIILDRPNPNGHYVDGPILEAAYQSFVGMHPIPVVHGLTVGELACMINEEGWLANGSYCNTKVIECEGYTHSSSYDLPIKPSPNLPNARSICLYPSLCFFEGTEVSIGRGTQQQFQIVGYPDCPEGNYTFIPESGAGAKYPKCEGELCTGYDLSELSMGGIRNQGLNLNWLISMYQSYSDKSTFFKSNLFIDKLAGTDQLRLSIIEGKTAEEIKAAWEDDLIDYKKMRKKYLLYPDFE